MSDGGGIDARIMLPKAVHSDAIQTLTKQETPIKMYTYWSPVTMSGGVLGNGTVG